ncbi:MAG: prolipoprotein diacylglyceryl transferase, partial [Paludibacteraceae bacterium]|nr:prolipoprotein diacylglyceryl transferase [Paludibacteraceae bacterium]
MLSSVVWNVDPILFKLGPVQVHWYGLMWAIGFLVGYYMLARMFKHEKCPDDWADK